MDKIKPFEYWVQKTLPAVYDDSLSYYQLLAKIVHHLNTIGDTQNEVIDKVKELMNWFDNLDVQDEINAKLDEMVEDGTLDQIINENIFNMKADKTYVDEQDQILNERLTETENNVSVLSGTVSNMDKVLTGANGGYDTLKEKLESQGINVVDFGAVADYSGSTNSTDNSQAFQNAVDYCKEGDTIFIPPGKYGIGSTIVINKRINIVGYGATLVTITNGMDNTIHVENVSNFKIEGLTFDQNLKGRTSINLLYCNNFVIKDCFFTGFTAEYGKGNTDGGIRVSSCNDGIITGNTWYKHGDQYDTTTATLNRCITLQQASLTDGYCNRITIQGNIFNKVNQAIIKQGGENIIIADNSFTEVRDNCLYALGGVGTTFTGNTLDRCYDEGLVIFGENYTISGNTFKEFPNKVIAINGYVKNVNIVGNIFNNVNIPGELGKVLAKRVEVTDLIENIVFNSNVVTGAFDGYAVIEIDVVRNFVCHDNYFNVEIDADYFNIIRVGGSTSNSGISIKDNRFYAYGKGTNVYAIRLVGSNYPNSIVSSNFVGPNCRLELGSSTDLKIIDQLFSNGNGGYYSNPASNILATEMPTRGVFKAGDFVRNIGGGNVFGWKRLTTGNSHVLGTDWIAIE